MSTPLKEPSFTLADLDSWAAQGLITPEQVAAIRAVASSTAGQPAPQRQSLNLLTIAYYFGGFMVLLAYTFFMGLNWETLGITGQMMVTVGTIVGLGTVGYMLRRGGIATPGNLLIFAATSIVPLLVYTIQRWTGLWPDENILPYADFYRYIRAQWIVMELVSLGAALLVVWLTRFPLVTLLAAFWSWYLSMDLVRWMTNADYWTWGDTERSIGLLMGLAMLAIGVFLQRMLKRDYSFWLYLFGHIIVLSHFASLAFEHEGIISLLFLFTYLAFVVSSVWLQRKLFLVFGALGCYGYASYLAFEVFDGALGFSFGLAATGLLIVVSAVSYQRYLQPWLERRLGRLHPTPVA